MKNKAEEWKQHITDYRSSGISAKEWCDFNHKSIHTLRYWITQFNKEQSDEEDQQWVSVPLNEQNTTNSPIILKIGTITIEVSEGFDKNVLVDVLSTVQNYDRCSRF